MIEYRELIDFLVKFFEIADEDVSALQARLRHLRNNGVPNKPSVGSGTRLKFDKADVWEITLALSLVSHGLSPFRVLIVINRIREQNYFRKVMTNEGDDLWLRLEVRGGVVRSTEEAAQFMLGYDLQPLSSVIEWLQKVENSSVSQRWHTFINLSKLTRVIERG